MRKRWELLVNLNIGFFFIFFRCLEKTIQKYFELKSETKYQRSHPQYVILG